MFRNYLTVALRNIVRYKLYSVINIAGLSVGLACTILIVLFARDELSYDKWIAGSANLWRVELTYHIPGRSDPIRTAQTSMPLPVAMRDQIPEVRSATRLVREFFTLTAGDRQFQEKIGVVDPNFLNVVPLPLVTGDPRNVLSRPENIVIAESAARKYFGDANPIGRTLTTGRGGCGEDTRCANTVVILKVVGVMRDLPHNTQFDFDFIIPNTSLADRIDQNLKKSWLSNYNSFGYVTLAPGSDPAAVLAKLKPILNRSVDFSAATNIKILGSKVTEPRLTHFQDAHLNTDTYGGMKPAGSWAMVYGISIIGLLILLVACFNFMNLATARATMRAHEISLRKCFGATRNQIIMQFLGESVLIAMMALVFALALVEILLPTYSAFLGAPLELHYFQDWKLSFGILAVTVVSGLLSGLYPAMVLSRFRPADVLRANKTGGSGSGTLRSILVVLQFAVSITLGIVAFVVFQQIDYARSIDLGFRRDNIVLTNTGGRLTEDGDRSFTQVLERGPGVTEVARTSFIPFHGNNSALPVQRPGDTEFLSPNQISVTQNYFHLFDIELLAGRVLQDNREEDSGYEGPGGVGDWVKNEGHNFMVNASLARALGYAPTDIINKIFVVGKSHMRVVGVVADTLSEGVRAPALQTAYVHEVSNLPTIVVRIAPSRTQEALAYIDKTTRSFVHGVAVQRVFLDDNYNRLYQADQKQGTMFAIFVGVAILIACLGLFGLAAFTAGRRTKEIGIRKVFGARNRDVVFLLLWQFSMPIIIANLIAWPIAWYYLHEWLNGFSYRITLNPLYFVGVSVIALLIAWLTILGHALRVARANPILALRYE
jgi:putative ABC transport system permease protein